MQKQQIIGYTQILVWREDQVCKKFTKKIKILLFSLIVVNLIWHSVFSLVFEIEVWSENLLSYEV